MEDEGLRPSESLSGVHIPGFDFSFSEEDQPSRQIPACAERTTKSPACETSGQPRKEKAVIQEPADESLDGGAPEPGDAMACGGREDAANATPNDQSMMSSVGRSETSAPSASTALYSCTSFGELRDALVQHVATPPGSSNPGLAATAASPSVLASSGSGTRLDPSILRHRQLRTEGSVSPPISIMRKDVVEDTPRAPLGKGLGLRKYASLDFDLDTIVSLDANLSHLTTTADTSGISTPPPLARRRVSFVDAPKPADSQQDSPKSPGSPDDNPQMSPTGWKSLNFGKYTSPNLSGNRLKKKRIASTPVLQNTPQLLEKVDLPAGLEQIGLGIGYTRPRPPQERPTTTETPRRSVSLGASVARCGALLTNLARGKRTIYGPDAKVDEEPDSARASQESDNLDAVMREMYGTAWDAELGMAPRGGITAPSTRRAPGRVYSVNAGQMCIDSTVRLVEPPQGEF